MLNPTFYITDVFSEQPYAGNQLATFPDAGDISSEEMQKITREFNFAETTFIVGGNESEGFDVRIFTPANEVPFAGHPVLGTAYLIREKIVQKPLERIVLNLKIGQIPVTFSKDDVLWMQQAEPVFGETLSEVEVTKAFGETPYMLNHDYPIQAVSTGLPTVIVPVCSLGKLRSLVLDPAACKLALQNVEARNFLLFAKEGYEQGQTLAVRMFAPSLGVMEDAATGSANGCLAAYLVKHQCLGSPEVDIKVGQGYEINRPSQLYLNAKGETGNISVKVGGRVRLVAEGKWAVVN